MYEEGFDLNSVAKRLQSMFTVEQGLPSTIRQMLENLRAAELPRTE
jgi:hypothetical protein